MTDATLKRRIQVALRMAEDARGNAQERKVAAAFVRRAMKNRGWTSADLGLDETILVERFRVLMSSDLFSVRSKAANSLTAIRFPGVVLKTTKAINLEKLACLICEGVKGFPVKEAATFWQSIDKSLACHFKEANALYRRIGGLVGFTQQEKASPTGPIQEYSWIMGAFEGFLKAEEEAILKQPINTKEYLTQLAQTIEPNRIAGPKAKRWRRPRKKKYALMLIPKEPQPRNGHAIMADALKPHAEEPNSDLDMRSYSQGFQFGKVLYDKHPRKL